MQKYYTLEKGCRQGEYSGARRTDYFQKKKIKIRIILDKRQKLCYANRNNKANTHRQNKINFKIKEITLCL